MRQGRDTTWVLSQGSESGEKSPRVENEAVSVKSPSAGTFQALPNNGCPEPGIPPREPRHWVKVLAPQRPQLVKCKC